ncbi:hypothetical protein FAZ19_09810 [Sphingobacterium alkalisoli]|uniref:Uncharacterized protein n=1 Tax=Sphingobacterium alkalisoli TaxID=1874115 RepID=A0A4U0H1J4_9SPHI|nr:hypothetical protein [Sphingobacterium alkalisoli]TJY65433.1 hypothetical protein FAZ19_09810 [Sphingobacterium alkalisoli]GGH20492.1 hypothetical protein GCM10011418_25740 [Sphingobacterium alkalisoli]
MKKQIFIIIIFFSSCISGGTLGGFDKRTFPTSKRALNNAIDIFYLRYPEYKMPDKWQDRDNWAERGYGFLEARIFYFNENPEEMYYVSFMGDSTMLADSEKISIAIRAVYNGGTGWILENDLYKQERERIETRFDKEIIHRLESYTQVKARREN